MRIDPRRTSEDSASSSPLTLCPYLSSSNRCMRFGSFWKQRRSAMRSRRQTSSPPSALTIARSAIISPSPLDGICFRCRQCRKTTCLAIPHAHGTKLRDGSKFSSLFKISITVSWKRSSASSKSPTIATMTARIRERFSVMFKNDWNECLSKKEYCECDVRKSFALS